MLQRVDERTEPWDLVVIGGGATGVGVAVDAASRGYSVALFDGADFGKGTSSRSTKLIHGGVRYLQQGNIPLVMEALRERGILRRNAPHLVSDLQFVVPNYAWWEAPFYGIGMKVYDALAGRYGFGDSRHLSFEETVERLPTIEREGLRGGVVYHDGQFDDARLLIALVRTAVGQGAVTINYAPVVALAKDELGFVEGVSVTDLESEKRLRVAAKVVVNATGPFSDSIRRMDSPDVAPIIRPSQGVHIVLPRDFLPGDAAIMVPHTDDGRVLFAIPWHERVLIGTTEVPLDHADLEPVPTEDEVTFLLEHAARYLTRDPRREDVLSVYAGIRPLVEAEKGDGDDTAELSREHVIRVSPSGLLTIAGGKWTTYRKMAEDVVDLAAELGELESKECATKHLDIHGHHPNAERFGEFAHYGTDAPAVKAIVDSEPQLGERVHPRLRLLCGEVLWFVREEMARTVEDVLARRNRALLLDARAAGEAAEVVATLMARELGYDDDWVRAQTIAFKRLAVGYLPRNVLG